jgi:fatty-acyl-CoA synthase
VAAAITSFPGVAEANVYGVRVPGSEGAAGMAAMVLDGALDLPEFSTHLARRLPPYARPLFLRVLKEMPVTATFKHQKNDLKREGYDPATGDALYFDDSKRKAFVPLTPALYRRIQSGKIRL